MVTLNWAQRESEANKPYSLFFALKGNLCYRCEYTPIANYEACIGRGQDSYFTYKLPPIPMKYLRQAFYFFKEVFDKYGTESALQLFYDRNKGEYFWYVPVQRVSQAAVHFERSYEMESAYWLVADFHSHGYYPAFFSSVDDRDEKGTRLYGVIGNLSGKPQLLLRAGTGGYFIPVEPSSVFHEDGTCGLSVLSLDNVLI